MAQISLNLSKISVTSLPSNGADSPGRSVSRLRNGSNFLQQGAQLEDHGVVEAVDNPAFEGRGDQFLGRLVRPPRVLQLDGRPEAVVTARVHVGRDPPPALTCLFQTLQFRVGPGVRLAILVR